MWLGDSAIKFSGSGCGTGACTHCFWLAVRLLLGGSLLSSPVSCVCCRVLMHWGVAWSVCYHCFFFGLCMLFGQFFCVGCVVVCRMSIQFLICHKSFFRGQRTCWLGCNSSCVLELCFVFSRGMFGGGSWWGGHWGLVV